MDIVSTGDFLNWARGHGLVIDPAYAETWPRNLKFSQPQSQSRYWCIPHDERRVSWFLETIIRKLETWEHLYMWPKSESLFYELHGEDDPVVRYITSTLKPLWDFRGALKCGRDDREALIALVFCIACYGWSWPTDVFLVPESGNALVMIEHHDVVRVEFACEERCATYVRLLKDEGIDLPAGPPDSTFKPAPWMEPE
jgi:hypothetical protein